MDFKPLFDAVVFGDSPVWVEVTRQFAFDLKGEIDLPYMLRVWEGRGKWCEYGDL